MVQKMWEKLESKLLALVSADEKVRALNLSQEELREKVNAFIEYYLLGGQGNEVCEDKYGNS